MLHIRAKQSGFTLIELLVVIAIIGLLASIVMVALSNARSKGRDVQRKANLKQIQIALELYYNDNGSYPSTAGVFWGQTSAYGSHGNSGATGYIPNLAPTYISSLPTDPFTGTAHNIAIYGGANCGATETSYYYRSDGVNYKAFVACTIESLPGSSDPFYDPIRPTTTYQVSTSGGLNW